MNIKILLVAASSVLLSANAFGESEMNKDESQIKEVRDGNPARITEEDEFANNDATAQANGESEMNKDESQIKEVRDGNPARITEEDEFANNDATAQANGESEMNKDESQIKEVRDGNPARITEEDEFKNNDATAEANSGTQTMEQGAAMKDQEQAQNNINIEGVTVIDSNGEPIGDVNKVVANDGEKLVVIGLSESLKEVAVPLSDLIWHHENLLVNASGSELESREDVDMSSFIVLEPQDYNIYDFARFEKAESEK